MISEPQLWRGELWRAQQLLDNLAIYLSFGFESIIWVHITGALKLLTVDDRCTVQKDEFIWIRDGKLESGDWDDWCEALEKDRAK